MPAFRVHLDTGHNLTVPSGQYVNLNHWQAVIEAQFHPLAEIRCYGILQMSLQTASGAITASTNGFIGSTSAVREFCLRRDAITKIEDMSPVPVASVIMVPTIIASLVL